MVKFKNIRTVYSVLLSLFIALTSFVSVFVKDPYKKESLSYASQGIGQDVYNMLVVSPILLIATLLMKRGSKLWENVWAGAMVYILYSYTIYGFAVHFNYLFLAYCSILGLSFFSLLFYHFSIDYTTYRVPEKLSGISVVTMIFLSAVAMMFAFLWLSDVIPSLISGTLPDSVTENDFFTNPVHVLDLSFVLPACVISVIMLARKNIIGRILSQVLLSLSMFMFFALSAMVLGMKAGGVTQEISPAFIFFMTGAFAMVILILFSNEKG